MSGPSLSRRLILYADAWYSGCLVWKGASRHFYSAQSFEMPCRCMEILWTLVLHGLRFPRWRFSVSRSSYRIVWTIVYYSILQIHMDQWLQTSAAHYRVWTVSSLKITWIINKYPARQRLGDLRFSQRWWWRNQSYETWHHVDWYTGADVSLENPEDEDTKLRWNNGAYVVLYMTHCTWMWYLEDKLVPGWKSLWVQKNGI